MSVALRICALVLLGACVSACSSISTNGLSTSEYREVEDLYSSAESSYAAGQLDVAEEKLIKLLQIDPNDNRALYRMGTVKFRKKNLDGAALDFGRVIANDPRHSRAHYNLATIRLMQAESHFKYYTATTDPKADVEAISKLLGAIEEFADVSKNKGSEQQNKPEFSVNRTLPQEFETKKKR